VSAVAVLVAVGTVLPIVYLVLRAGELGLDGIEAIVVRPRTLDLLVTTALVCGGVAVVTLVLGIGTAVVVTRVRLPLPRLWWVVVALPVAMPSYVAAFALVAVRPGTHGVVATIAVIALTTYPYVTLPTLAALSRADLDAADVARSLGASRTRAFATVVLPQVLPAAIAGCLLCVLYALSDFAAPALLRTPTLTVGVYGLFTGSLNRSHAAALGLVVVAVALVFVAVEQLARRRAGHRLSAVAVRRVAPARQSVARTALAAAVVLAPPVLIVVVPVATLLGRLLGGSRYAPELADLVAPAFTTFVLGATVAVLAVLAAMPVAALGARWRHGWIRGIEGVSFLGQALPGIVVGLAVVFMTLRLAPSLYQTLPMLLLAYVIVFLPKSIGASRTAVQQVSPQLEEVARTLGRRRTAAWWGVTARHAWPGIATGAVLVMAATMKEVPMTLMIRPIGVDTLATELWSKTSIGAFGAAAPAALALVVVGLVPAWLLSRAAAR